MVVRCVGKHYLSEYHTAVVRVSVAKSLSKNSQQSLGKSFVHLDTTDTEPLHGSYVVSIETDQPLNASHTSEI